MKKLVILKHGGGELANQLWNYVSIYAYALEKGITVQNPSFFEYHPYFRFIDHEIATTKIFSFWFRDFSGRRSSLRNRFWRFIYALYSKMVASLHPSSLVSSENVKSERAYLPPTKEMEFPNKETLYFLGWLFRNPTGLAKWRNSLIGAFAPNESILNRADMLIESLRKTSETVIGLHIRQGDYKIFKDGRYLISQSRVRQIVDEFLSLRDIDPNKATILITSDGPIDQDVFKGLNICISKENAVTDLFLLSKTDAILSSDSSFGAFASWYGNIPHVVMTSDPIDWSYYNEKTAYFENKYATLARY